MLDIEELLVTLNIGSRDRTNEQKAREFALLKRVEETRSKERQIEAGKTYGEHHSKEELVENFPQALPIARKTI